MDKLLKMDKFYMCKIYSTLQKSKPPNARNDSTLAYTIHREISMS